MSVYGLSSNSLTSTSEWMVKKSESVFVSARRGPSARQFGRTFGFFRNCRKKTGHFEVPVLFLSVMYGVDLCCSGLFPFRSYRIVPSSFFTMGMFLQSLNGFYKVLNSNFLKKSLTMPKNFYSSIPWAKWSN